MIRSWHLAIAALLLATSASAKDYPDGTGAQVPGSVIVQSGVGPVSPSNPLPVTATSSVGSLTPVKSSAAEASHVLKSSAGSLFGLSVTSGAVAGYVMVFNATSAPADGAVTPVYCFPVPAAQWISGSWPAPAAFSTGIVAVFSSTGCFTKTGSATAFFSGQVN